MSVEVEVEVRAWTDALPDAAAVARHAAEAATQTLGAVGDVVVLLTGDDEVRALNARFRGKDAATNVLSFPAAALPPGAPAGAQALGDVALASGVCLGEAAAQAKPPAAHLSHLVVHGVLHLLGYDHEVDDAAEAMEGLEAVILARLGWPDPYRGVRD